MKNRLYISVRNCEAIKISDIPVLLPEDFRETVIENTRRGKRIASMFGVPAVKKKLRIYAVLAEDEAGCIHILSFDAGDSYEALTPLCPQAHMFEREIAEKWGVIPAGHPCLKPLRFHHSFTGNDAWNRSNEEVIIPGDMDFYKVAGEEIHEVAVGPVHAGVIEPGHFRFQCHGEKVFNLEISLGYQHRGIEQVLIDGPDSKSIHIMETIAGDSSIAHASAYCQALESLSGCKISARSQYLRGIALELERIANHTGDLGALSGDVAYLPTASFCGRLRGDFLNMTADICGNRFGRGFVCPGGTGCDLSISEITILKDKLEKAYLDTENAVKLLWATPSVLGRFEYTGRITGSICNSSGIVGVAARACGIERDVRFNFARGIYQHTKIPVATFSTGDVYARAMVRWDEIRISRDFISKVLPALSSGDVMVECPDPQPEMFVVSMIEGWRGEICHTAITNKEGKFSSYKIVDPSFHNWTGLAMALRNEEISNFPLINKSFNLSYCGHDL